MNMNNSNFVVVDSNVYSLDTEEDGRQYLRYTTRVTTAIEAICNGVTGYSVNQLANLMIEAGLNNNRLDEECLVMVYHNCTRQLWYRPSNDTESDKFPSMLMSKVEDENDLKVILKRNKDLKVLFVSTQSVYSIINRLLPDVED